MKKIKIKFTGFWTDDESLFYYIIKLNFNNIFWKNLEITNSNSFDYLVVLTRPSDYSILNQLRSEQVILFLTEPFVSNNVDHNLIKEYNEYNLEYFFTPTWNKISNLQFDQVWGKKLIKKTKLFSSVCSELYSENPDFPGYYNRLRFIHYFDNCTENTMDLYGRKYTGKFFNKIYNYKGEILNKYDALIKYKYHFSAENSNLPGYFTEKIVDPILSECLCFYSGCPDISNILNEDSYVQLDLEDPEKSFWTVCNAINDNLYEKKIDSIRSTKIRLLTEINPINLVWKKLVKE